MSFGDIYVLHLSDLHIEAKANGSYSNSLGSLIDDLEVQLKNVAELILVISGDIINKGTYNNENIEATKDFFLKLKEILGNRVIDVQIVPGNHDKQRNKINKLLCKDHTCNGLKNEEDWDSIIESYSYFFKNCKTILDIFGFSYDDGYNNTFGIKLVRSNNKNLCFIRLDTAWCSCADSQKDESDYRKLKIGEYQLSKLKKEYQTIKRERETVGEEINLTVVLSHHPLDWLDPEDEEACENSFLSEDELNADILLCGHVHNFSLMHYFNHVHSILTLVTGFAGEETRIKDNHRYSLYVLNLANNSCDIIMRRTTNNNKFKSDYSVYTGINEEKREKLTYPIRVRESHPFISMTAPSPLLEKSLYIGSSMLSEIPKISSALSDFTRSMANKNSNFKMDCLDKIVSQFEETDETEIKDESELDISLEDHHIEEILERIQDYLLLGEEITSEEKEYLRHSDVLKDFFGFLQQICIDLVDCLIECFPQNTTIRAHFRKYHEKYDKYVLICHYSYNEPPDCNPPKPVNWGGLIELAFNEKKPVVFSATTQLNKTETNWNDFMTIVPQFYDNQIEIKTKNQTGKKVKYEKRPLFTFGLSIRTNFYTEQLSKVLYLLSFLRLDEVLATTINDYINIFELNPSDFSKKLDDLGYNQTVKEHTNE